MKYNITTRFVVPGITVLVIFILSMAPLSCAKAEFTLGQLEVSPSVVVTGQEATVSVTVTNTGKAEGTYDAALTVNGVVTETRQVSVAAGSTQTVAYKLMQKYVGAYTVAVGNQSRTFNVVKPAEFQLGSLSVSPAEVIQSKESTVSVDVSNIGGIEGTYTCTMVLSGAGVQTKDIVIPPGSTQKVNFTLTPDRPGTTEVTIGGLSKTITVLRPAYFKLTDLKVPSIAEFGSPQMVTVSATVSNTGDVQGTYRAKLLADGREIDTKEVKLQGGGSQMVTFDFTPGKAGVLQLAIDELSTVIKVFPSRPILVSPLPGAILDNARNDYKDTAVWDFDWNDTPGATMYELYVIGANAVYPVINTQTTSSSFHRVGTGYIVNQNRFGWTWKVRAFAGGLWSEWSEVRIFDVEPLNSDPPSAPTALPPIY